jgi:hypothetical protein
MDGVQYEKWLVHGKIGLLNQRPEYAFRPRTIVDKYIDDEITDEEFSQYMEEVEYYE